MLRGRWRGRRARRGPNGRVGAVQELLQVCVAITVEVVGRCGRAPTSGVPELGNLPNVRHPVDVRVVTGRSGGQCGPVRAGDVPSRPIESALYDPGIDRIAPVDP